MAMVAKGLLAAFDGKADTPRSESETTSEGDNTTFNKKKAESIIKYMVDSIDNVEEDDLTVEEVAEFLESENDAESIATEILDHAAEDNSRLDYGDDDGYEIAKIIRKRNTNARRDKDQPLSLNDKKASAILEYLIGNCDEIEEGDLTADEIADILEANGNSGVEDTATAVLDHVSEENSRFDYGDDDVYELARIIRKRRM